MAKKEMKEISTAQAKEIVTAKEILASKEDVLKQLGQIEAFEFVNKLAIVANLKIIQEIKETKAYKGLTYIDENGKLATIANFEDFCNYKLNSPKRTIDDRLLNLKSFGEEFYEASQKIGLGSRDLRKLRQLPSDDKQLIIGSEAVDLGDKEAIKELIEDLDITHKKEIIEKDSQLKASRESSTETAIKLQDAQEKLAQRKFTAANWQDEVKDFFACMHKVHNSMTENINQLMELNEQLGFTEMDERSKEAATSAFYADNKLMVEQFSLAWNEIYRSLAHVEETAKPSGEWMAEMGFEGMGEEA